MSFRSFVLKLTSSDIYTNLGDVDNWVAFTLTWVKLRRGLVYEVFSKVLKRVYKEFSMKFTRIWNKFSKSFDEVSFGVHKDSEFTSLLNDISW